MDLEEVYQIDEINLFNRTDNRPDRFSDFYVLVSDVPFASQDLEASLSQVGVFNYYQAANAGSPTTVTVGRTGRYVRVQLNYTEHLTITEVEVIGCTTGVDETAPTATLSTSSNEVNSPFDVSLKFSEGVSGLSLGDFEVANAALANLSGSGANYSFVVIPESNGIVTIQLLAGSVVDGADNENTASNTLTVEYDEEGGSDEYCQPLTEFPWHDWISNVKLGNLDNASGKSNYSDFTSLTANLTAGSNYTIELTTAYSYTGFEDHFSVWIDFNQDNDFEDAGELVFSGVNEAPTDGTPSLTVSGNIVLSPSAQTGITRMRVAMKRDEAADPCELYEFGEIEDYTVNIDAATAGASERAMLYFTAERKIRAVELNWVSNTEFKNDHFIIERSADGKNYEALLKVAKNGKNDFAPTSYLQMDESPMSGANYYRLKQVYTDGSHVYTDYQKVVFDFDLTKVKLYPNPSRGDTWIDLSKYEGKSAKVMIYNNLGQLMLERQIELIQNEPEQFDLRTFENGVYHIAVKVDGHRLFTEKLVLRRMY